MKKKKKRLNTGSKYLSLTPFPHNFGLLCFKVGNFTIFKSNFKTFF